MSGTWTAEIGTPDGQTRQVAVEGTVEVGRDCDGVVLEDGKVSRRHLTLTGGTQGVVVTDLGSTNGTFVNGDRIAAPTTVTAADVVRLGDTELRVRPRDPSSGDAAGSDTTDDTVEDTPVASRRPALEELDATSVDGAVLRYQPGSAGADAVDEVAGAVRTARRRLAGFGSEPWGVQPEICLVDPFPDPEREGEVVTEGTIVDPQRGEIWMVVTPESPPEPPERPLALLFGASLPAAEELGMLLEGYGLHVGEAPDPDPVLREQQLPSLRAAEGELASAMALSFVRFLIHREDDEAFRRFLATARPGRADQAARQEYGTTFANLEETWRQELATGAPQVKLREFLRLSMGHLRPHRRRQVELVVWMVLGLAFTLVFPFAFRELLDSAIPAGELDVVFLLLGALAAAFAVSVLAQLRRAYLAAAISGAVARDLRNRIFDRLQTLSAGWFQRHQSGDVLARISADVSEVEQGLSQIIRDALLHLITIAAMATVLIVLSPALAIVVLLAAPLMALVYQRMSAGALKRSMDVQERSGSLLSVTSENYEAQPVVKVFGLERREGGRFRRSSDELYRAQVSLNLFGGLFTLSINSIVNMLQLAVFGLGAWLILQGHLTIGGLVAFVSVMGEVLNPVSMLTRVGQQLQSSTGALHRVNEVVDAVPEVSEQEAPVQLPPLSSEIRLEGVDFGYQRDEQVLHGVGCTIPAGSRVAFVGPSGAGKSSVIALITRFYDPDAGTVRFDGHDLREVSLASLRNQLGVVFQETFLFDTTIRENIRMGRLDATDEQVEQAARTAEAHDFIMQLPAGYDTPVGERGGRLSGGQRQRLAIARALLRDPAVLVLDEATSALDPRTERAISTTLREVARGRTTVAVTHRLTSCVDYDRIFVLKDGRLVEQGDHEELLARSGVYAELWAEQTGVEVAPSEPVDVDAALRAIPVFAQLTSDELETVAARLRPRELAPGEQLTEEAGRLALVRSGRARILTVGIDGTPRPTAMLEPGGYFGLSALYGHEHNAALEAVDRVELLLLDRDAIGAIAEDVPSVDAALSGAPRATAGPAGGHRLSRATFRPSHSSQAVSGAVPDVEDIRRSSGALPAVR